MTRNKVAEFIKSYEVINDITSDISDISINDIYYIEYCKQKAQELLRDNRNSIEKATLESIIKQCESLENMVTEISDEDTIDKFDGLDNPYSVRIPKNKVYSSVNTLKSIDILAFPDNLNKLCLASTIISSLLLLIITKNSLYGLIALVFPFIYMITCGAYLKYQTSKYFDLDAKKKQDFISTILEKIILVTHKDEYYEAVRRLNQLDINRDNITSLVEVFVKIELLGEYINENYNNTLIKTEFIKRVENELSDISSHIRKYSNYGLKRKWRTA